jgi:hypothetical protein
MRGGEFANFAVNRMAEYEQAQGSFLAGAAYDSSMAAASHNYNQPGRRKQQFSPILTAYRYVAHKVTRFVV